MAVPIDCTCHQAINTHSQVGGTLLVSPGLIWEHKDFVPSTHLEHSLRYGRFSVCLCQGGSFEFSGS